MYEAIEALEALYELETMGKAAARLRITQSAVSKRIAALQTTVGAELIQRSGRQVRLTARGTAFLNKARPLVHELNALLQSFGEEDETALRGRIVLGVGESVLASWGAASLQAAAARIPGLTLELHSHRSHLAIEHVRSGDYMLGLCTDPLNDQSLASEVVVEEPLAIVPSGLKKLRPARGEALEVISVEESSATWIILQERFKRRGSTLPYRFSWGARVESFAAVVQMARAGLGHGLVPLGIARAMGVPDPSLLILGKAFRRPISLIGRPTIMGRPLVQEFKRQLRAAVPEF